MAFLDQIKALTRQLFPTGRAFLIPYRSSLEKLLDGLHASEARAYADAVSILNSILPDNSNFTVDDASAWENRLGLITNTSTSLSDRKLAIARKMAHPGTIKARQNYLYVQGQLQAAGFDVYVYENRFPDYFVGYVTKTPPAFSLLPFPSIGNQLGDKQLGDFQLGGSGYGNKVANSIYQEVDDLFQIGPTYRSTFFIGGATPGSWAVVPASRKIEFRQLILKLKPTQEVAYLLIAFY